MGQRIDLATVQARRQRIEEEMARETERHEKVMATLREEANEVAIAERVFARLLGSEPEEAVPLAAAIHTETNAHGTLSSRPTVPEMIKTALLSAQESGRSGAPPATLLSFVRERWWPEAKSGDVGPTAWRMWKDGRLVKEGKMYRLPPVPGSEEQAVSGVV